MAENELKMALRIDPNDGFAQETVARLLYKMPDSKKQAVLGRRWHKQAASIAAVLVVVAGVWATFPRHSSAADPTVEGNSPEAIALGGGARPTAAPAQAAAPAAAPAAAGQTLPKLAADFQPDGAKRDYTTQTITRKTYYPAQGMVIAACKDGGMLNYKPTELLGWKQGEAGKVILITKTGEMIPAPAGVPLLMPNGENVNVKDKSFPLHLFPEYGTTTIKTAAAAAPAATAGGGF